MLSASELPRRHFVEARDEQAVTEAIGQSITTACLIGGAPDAIGGSHDSESLDPQQQLRQTLTKKTGYVQYGSDDETGDKTLIASEPGLYPFLVANCGSLILTTKVTASGLGHVLGISSSGGRAMLGQANKLIGVKTYEELVNLASTGDSFNVGETFADLLFTDTEASEENLYTNAFKIEGTDKAVAYGFSKLVGCNNCGCDSAYKLHPTSTLFSSASRIAYILAASIDDYSLVLGVEIKCQIPHYDDFRKEDIASALLDSCVQDIVRTVQLDCCKSGIKRVIFSGGLFTHPYVRHVVAREMIKKNLLDFLLHQAEPVVFDLLKGAPYMTAVGCLVRDHKAQTEQVEAIDIQK